MEYGAHNSIALIDKRFRIHNSESLRKSLDIKRSVERANSRLSALLSEIIFRDLRLL